LPVFPGGLHGHKRLVDQRVLRLRVGQCAGNGEHAVAAAQVGNPGRAQVFRQVGQERPGTDIQVFAAEHVGMVEQLDGRLVQSIAGRVGRGKWSQALCCGDQQPGLLDRQRGMHRADITLQQIASSPRQVLDHRARDHLGTRCQLTLQADQLFFKQGQGLRHAYQHAVEWPCQWFTGRNDRDRIVSMAVAHQVFFQRLHGQEGVTAAGDLHCAHQADRQGPKAVIEHQHPAVCGQRLFGQVIKQILIRRIKGLQGLVLLLGLADQAKLGERAF